jgi:hypothetical protein
MPAADRKAYIAAMLCIMEKPSKLDPTKFPGAKTRYDDFVVVHMNQTLNIHGTVCAGSSRRCNLDAELVHREASSPGTATTPGPLSAFSARSADSMALSR